jgi:chromosome segregation ATPase
MTVGGPTNVGLAVAWRQSTQAQPARPISKTTKTRPAGGPQTQAKELEALKLELSRKRDEVAGVRRNLESLDRSYAEARTKLDAMQGYFSRLGRGILGESDDYKQAAKGKSRAGDDYLSEMSRERQLIGEISELEASIRAKQTPPEQLADLEKSVAEKREELSNVRRAKGLAEESVNEARKNLDAMRGSILRSLRRDTREERDRLNRAEKYLGDAEFELKIQKERENRLISEIHTLEQTINLTATPRPPSQ